MPHFLYQLSILLISITAHLPLNHYFMRETPGLDSPAVEYQLLEVREVEGFPITQKVTIKASDLIALVADRVVSPPTAAALPQLTRRLLRGESLFGSLEGEIKVS